MALRQQFQALSAHPEITIGKSLWQAAAVVGIPCHRTKKSLLNLICKRRLIKYLDHSWWATASLLNSSKYRLFNWWSILMVKANSLASTSITTVSRHKTRIKTKTCSSHASSSNSSKCRTIVLSNLIESRITWTVLQNRVLWRLSLISNSFATFNNRMRLKLVRSSKSRSD